MKRKRLIGKQHPPGWVPMVRQEAQVRTGRVDNAVQEAIQEVEGRCAVILEHELPVHTAALTSILLTLPWDHLNNNRAVNGSATRGFSLGLRRVGPFITIGKHYGTLPNLCKLLQRYVRQELPFHTYTAVQLNYFHSNTMGPVVIATRMTCRTPKQCEPLASSRVATFVWQTEIPATPRHPAL
jgi:hypothetical protein